MVGTFYSSPAPGEDAFVQIGSKVSIGQTICILEAMKLMNELEAENGDIRATWNMQNGEVILATVCSNYTQGSINRRTCNKKAQEEFRNRCNQDGSSAYCRAYQKFNPII